MDVDRNICECVGEIHFFMNILYIYLYVDGKLLCLLSSDLLELMKRANHSFLVNHMLVIYLGISHTHFWKLLGCMLTCFYSTHVKVCNFLTCNR